MWKAEKLGEIVNLSMGKTPSRDNAKFWDKEKITKNIWLSIADLSALGGLYVEDSKEYVSDEGAKLFKTVPSETLVMSFKLSIGKLAITKCELRTNEAIAALPIKDEKLITKEYLYYFLSSITWDALAGNDVKVKGKTLNKAKLKEIPIYYPPLAEQQRIVAKLDAAFAEIDAAIAAADSKETEVQKLKASLLSSSLSGDAVMWKTVKLGDLFKIGSSKRVLKAEWKDSGVPFYRGREITTLSKTGNVDNDLFISEEHFSQLKSKYGVPQEGDLVVTAIGTIGSTYIVREQDRFYFKDASVLWLQKISDVNSRFVDYWFKSSSFFEQLQVGTGTTVDTLSISKLNVMDFPLPPLAEQQRIVTKLDAAFANLGDAKDAVAKSKLNYQSLKSSILAQELQSEAV